MGAIQISQAASTAYFVRRGATLAYVKSAKVTINSVDKFTQIGDFPIKRTCVESLIICPSISLNYILYIVLLYTLSVIAVRRIETIVRITLVETV